MTKREKPLKTALIGLGMVAETHVRALADLKDKIHLQGVHARSVSSADAFAQQVNQICGHTPDVYKSVDEIVADDLDFAIIATPPNARLELVRKLAGAGVHILMEKPIERTSDAALDIVNICDKHSVALGIVFQHRVRGASTKLEALMTDGAFGKLGLVEVNVPWWRDQAYYDEPGRGTFERDGGGVLISQAIHTLDLMLSLTGPVAEVQAMARTSRFHTMETEDFVTAGLVFKNGAIGSLVASTASFPGAAETITLHFDNAVAHLKTGIIDVTWRDGKTEQFGEDSTSGSGADPMAFTHAWHRGIIEDFADAIVDGRDPIATGRASLNVHFLIDALIASSNSKQAVQVKSTGNH